MYEHVSNSTLSVFIKTRERESRKRVKEDKEEKEKKTPDVAWKVDWDRIGCFH